MARVIQGIVTKHKLMKQTDGGHQQGRRRRRRRLPRRQELQGQPAQAGHHAVEPVHHAARHRHSVLVEGPDPGRHDGARRVRALGQCRHALQDRRRTTSTPRRPRRGTIQDGRHRLQAGRPDHHGRDREGDRRQVHLHPLQGRRRGRGPARRQARQFDGQQSDRGGGAVARRPAPAALRVRRQAAAGTRTRSPATWRGPTSRPASRRASTSST